MDGHRDRGISCTGLKKTLANGDIRLVVDVPHLAIAPGEIAAIVGPNGIGKTTLLRLVAGIIAPDAGAVQVARPLLCFTSMERQFNHRIPADWNLGYTLALFGAPARPRRDIHAALEAVGLGERARMPVARLSKGQKARLALALVRLAPWRTLILDEPTNGLDGEGLDLLITTLRESAAGGAAVLVSTHDRDFLTEGCDTLVTRGEDGCFAALPKADRVVQRAFSVRQRSGETEVMGAAALARLLRDSPDSIDDISGAGLLAEEGDE